MGENVLVINCVYEKASGSKAEAEGPNGGRGRKTYSFRSSGNYLLAKMSAKDRRSSNKRSLYLIYRSIMIVSPRIIWWRFFCATEKKSGEAGDERKKMATKVYKYTVRIPGGAFSFFSARSIVSVSFHRDPSHQQNKEKSKRKTAWYLSTRNWLFASTQQFLHPINHFLQVIFFIILGN